MYLIILTAKNNEADIVSGLRAGADDYISKPPVPAELRARVRVGERILALQDAVEAQRILTNQAAEKSIPFGESIADSRARSVAGQEKIEHRPETASVMPWPLNKSLEKCHPHR